MTAAAMEPIVLAEGLRFPEGPVFDASGALWCVELQGGALARIAAPGDVRRFEVGGAPNGLAAGADGSLWICDAMLGAVRRLEPKAGRLETVIDALDGAPLDKPNDLAFHPSGGLVFSCPGDSRTEPTGYVVFTGEDGRSKRLADGLYFPNGVAFDAAGDLIVAETRRQRLWRGGFDPAGAWINPQVLCQTSGPIGPDGLAVARDGRLFVAAYGASHVAVFAPDGEALAPLPIPGANPSNCAFDPHGRWGLVVTETEHGRLLAYPHAGPGLPLALGPDHFGVRQ